MSDDDVDQFADLLSTMWSLYPKWPALSAAQGEAFFRALLPYPIDAIKAGLNAHVAKDRGQFPPAPSDVIAQIQRADGRLGAEEAWSTALRANDESETVVWHEETAAAFAVAKPLLDARDVVGARMAFREAYERLVAEARAAGRPPEVKVSLGHDTEKRAKALKEAHATGLLAAPTEQMQLLEGPGGKDAGFEALMRNPNMPKHVFDKLMALKAKVAARVEKPEITMDPGIARTNELRAIHDEKLRTYLHDNPQAAADYEATIRRAEELLKADNFRAPPPDTLPRGMRAGESMPSRAPAKRQRTKARGTA